MEKKTPRLHIIVNCANRKRVLPEIALRDINETELNKRVSKWWKHLNNRTNNHQIDKFFAEKKEKLKASDLYIGSYWSIIRQLPSAAINAGFEPMWWIISAGYGLISASDEIYPYSATFVKGNSDSVLPVGSKYEGKFKFIQNWWYVLSTYSLQNSQSPRRLSELIKRNCEDYFLVVVSSDYLSAIQKDLLEGIIFLEDSKQLIIVTSKSNELNAIFANHYVPTDARLQCTTNCFANCDYHLLRRGIRGTIGANLALKIIQNVKTWGFSASFIRNKVEEFIRISPELINHERTRLDDKQIAEYIASELKNPLFTSSASLLRELRSRGYACEQKRFSQLYRETKENMK